MVISRQYMGGHLAGIKWVFI